MSDKQPKTTNKDSIKSPEKKSENNLFKRALSFAANLVTRPFVGTPEQQEKREQKRMLAKLLTEKLAVPSEHDASGRLAKMIMNKDNGFPVEDILRKLKTLNFDAGADCPDEKSCGDDFIKVLKGALNGNKADQLKDWARYGIDEASYTYSALNNALRKRTGEHTRLYIQAFLKAGYSLSEISGLLKDPSNQAVLLAPNFVKNIAQDNKDTDYKSNIESALKSAKSQKEQGDMKALEQEQSDLARQKERETYIPFKLGQARHFNITNRDGSFGRETRYESLEKIKYSLAAMLGTSAIESKLEKTINNIATVLDRDTQYRSANNYYGGSEQQRLKTQIDSFLELVNNVVFLMDRQGITAQYTNRYRTAYTSNLPFPATKPFMEKFNRDDSVNGLEYTLSQNLDQLTSLLQKNKEILEKQWDDQQFQENKNTLERLWNNQNQSTTNTARSTTASSY